MNIIKSINPANNSVFGKVNSSSQEEVKEAVRKAKEAKLKWKELGVKNRVELMRRVYEVLHAHKDEIAQADTQEMGFPITQCYDFNLGDAFSYFKWYLENAEKYLAPETTHETDQELHQVFYEPHGVVAVIQPWNFPFCQWSWSAVPNLIAGNTVVYKPSEEVPLSAKLIEKIISEAKLPEGVLNFVYGAGDVGEYLVNQDIDLIVFTGSTQTGQKLYQVAAEKFIPALLELGGSAPGIVFEDADIDEAVEAIYWQRYANCGQMCDGLKRLIVHDKIFDEVIEKLKKRLSKSIIGDPNDNKTDFGPLAAERQLTLLESQVEDALNKGAKVICGGKRPENMKGYYYEPTILTNIKTNMRVWQEEVFGPVLPIISFNTEEQAISYANNTKYGLGAYVYTSDENKADYIASRIEAGMVSINATNYVLPINPFGGYKMSGLGREHGKWGLRELCQIKVVASNKNKKQ